MVLDRDGRYAVGGAVAVAVLAQAHLCQVDAVGRLAVAARVGEIAGVVPRVGALAQKNQMRLAWDAGNTLQIVGPLIRSPFRVLLAGAVTVKRPVVLGVVSDFRNLRAEEGGQRWAMATGQSLEPSSGIRMVLPASKRSAVGEVAMVAAGMAVQPGGRARD